MNVRVLVDRSKISIVAAHRAEDGPPPEMAVLTAAIAAKLDAAGIGYTIRSFTATIRPPAPVIPWRRRDRHGRG